MQWNRNWKWWALGGFLATAFLLYVRALGAPFLFDDINVAYLNDAVFGLWGWQGILGHNRPLVMLSYYLNNLTGGPDPFLYRLTGLLFHGVNAWLVALLFLQLYRYFQPETPFRHCRWPALTAGALYLVHPLASSAVMMISARSELFCTFFYLLGLIMFLRFEKNPGRHGWLILAFIMLGGALSKEIVITFPAACLLLLLLRGEKLRAAWRRLLPFLTASALVAGMIILRVMMFDWQGAVAGSGLPFNRQEYFMTQVTAFVHYLKVFLLPLPAWQNGDWNFPVVRSPGDSWFLICSLLLLAVCSLLFLAIKKFRQPAAGWSGIMFFLAFAPAASIIPIADPVVDYRAYLPLSFLCLALTGAGLACWQRWKSRVTAAGPAMFTGWKVAALVVLLPAGLLLQLRLTTYLSPEAFWLDCAVKSPGKQRPLLSLAYHYLSAGQLEESLRLTRALLAAKPGNDTYRSLLADIYREMGRTEAALAEYNEALRLKPGALETAQQKCYLLIRLNRLEEARQLLDSVPPDGRKASWLLNRGILYARSGQTQKAIECYGELLRRFPPSAIIYSNLGFAFLSLNRLAEAEMCFQQALLFRPRFPLALMGFSQLHTRTGRYDEAIADLESARRANRWFAGADLELANLLARLRRYRESRPVFEEYLRKIPADASAWEKLALVCQELGDLSCVQNSQNRAAQLRAAAAISIPAGTENRRK